MEAECGRGAAGSRLHSSLPTFAPSAALATFPCSSSSWRAPTDVSGVRRLPNARSFARVPAVRRGRLCSRPVARRTCPPAPRGCELFREGNLVSFFTPPPRAQSSRSAGPAMSVSWRLARHPRKGIFCIQREKRSDEFPFFPCFAFLTTWD